MPDLPSPSASSPAIFLSYASEDAEAARRIAEALGKAGLVVWFDQSELRGGDAWDQRIRRQIKECALFMPVISAHTQARAEGYFRLEWHLAEQRSYLMAQSKVFIVPVVVDSTPDADALVPDRFRERQWTRLPEGHVPFDFAPRVAQLLGAAAPGARPSPAPAQARAAAAPANERSVAVLAFANLSDDRENEYFSEGVSDELMTVLQNVPGLRVAARTSAFSFKGKNASIREIGSQLDVAHLVEGAVQKSGNRVKVAARLTSVATGVIKWSRSYTRELRDVFALQEELALAIVGELRGQLAGDEALVQQANRGGTRVPAAYESYLLGKHLYEQSSEAPVTQAADHLRRATELDPDFALAWVYLASVQVWRCSYLGSLTREQFDSALDDARRAVDRALSLEPELGSAWAVRGVIQLLFEFNVKGAGASLHRAEQLAPNDRSVLFLSSQLMTLVRTAAEAVQLGRQIVARDPVNARPHFVLSWALAECGLFEEARMEAARFRDLNPQAVMASVAVTYILAMEGRYAEAEEAMQPSPARWPELWMRGIVSHGLGKRAESDAALEEMKERFSAAGAVQIAQIHAFRGENDQAFHWLEKARQQRDPGILLLARSIFLRNIRGDPRWAGFWQGLGFEVGELA